MNITDISLNELEIIANDLLSDYTLVQKDMIVEAINDSSIDSITGVRDFIRFEVDDYLLEVRGYDVHSGCYVKQTDENGYVVDEDTDSEDCYE